jgi:hypothetical protein
MQIKALEKKNKDVGEQLELIRQCCEGEAKHSKCEHDELAARVKQVETAGEGAIGGDFEKLVFRLNVLERLADLQIKDQSEINSNSNSSSNQPGGTGAGAHGCGIRVFFRKILQLRQRKIAQDNPGLSS